MGAQIFFYFYSEVGCFVIKFWFLAKFAVTGGPARFFGGACQEYLIFEATKECAESNFEIAAYFYKAVYQI